MNKLKTLGILAVSLLCCSSAAFAQKNNKAPKCAKTEMCAKDCKPADCKQKPDCCMGADNKTNPMFEGITLSQEQKDKLAALKCTNNKPVQGREKFANRDSIAKAQKRANLAEIKQILTPEQYVVFLENVAVNRPGGNLMHMQRMHKMAPQKNNKKAKRDMRVKGSGRQQTEPSSTDK